MLDSRVDFPQGGVFRQGKEDPVTHRRGAPSSPPRIYDAERGTLGCPPLGPTGSVGQP